MEAEELTLEEQLFFRFGCALNGDKALKSASLDYCSTSQLVAEGQNVEDNDCRIVTVHNGQTSSFQLSWDADKAW